MLRSDDLQEVIAESKKDLTFIWDWVRKREDKDHPKTILIGGWAVYTYNPWYGSIDIDLVTNSKVHHKLMHYLKHERGYQYRRSIFSKTVVRPIGPNQNIIIDFMTRTTDWKLEGRTDEFDFSEFEGRSLIHKMDDMIELRLPTRSLLLILKLKACWDRRHRLTHGISSDIVGNGGSW